ncbi:MAG: TatD family hydrolase [Planctomycetota bacterium]|jgi:TatD DNase family protein
MKLIDTHCHLAHGRLRQNASDVIARAEAAGLVACICATGDLHEARTAAHIAEEYAAVTFTVGVHPHDAKDVDGEAIRQVAELAGHELCVAFGEIGLDYHYDHSPRDAQRTAFAAQLELAKGVGKPIVIHTREATDDTLAIVAEAALGDQPLVFHSFTGGPEEARRVLDTGATISYSGIATFNRADDIRQAVALTPDDRLLIETDSPYLSPEPVRNMRTNEPANVAHVAARLAKVRGLSAEAFAELTTQNAATLFQLDISSD